jgi:DNA-binding MarR family transcriptional regulator
MCSTTAYDRAHEVISQMGDRFLLIRLDDDEPEVGMLNALEGAGKEGRAREELAEAVTGLLGHPPEHRELVAAGEDKLRIAKLANFITLARSPVARDYRGEIELVMDREAPYRFGKQLYALWRACGLLGMTREQAWEVADRIARDSLPKLRWRVLEALAKGEGELSTNTAARAVKHPYKSTKRTLEDLTAHGVVERRTVELDGSASKDLWVLTEAGEPVKLLAGAGPDMSDPPQVEDPTLPLELEP